MDTNADRSNGARPFNAAFVGFICLGVAVSGLLSGCRKPLASTAAAAPVVQVVVVEARRQPVSEMLSLSATVAANETVEIKPETDGIVQDIPFSEGEHV